MQTILRAIANGNLSMGTETIEHNSKSKKAMKEVCELKESLNAILNDSEKNCLKNWKIYREISMEVIHSRVLSMGFVLVHL